MAPEEDLAVFTAKISRIITDAEMREAMSQKSKDVSINYSIENTTQTMNDCYQKLYLEYSGKKRNLFQRITGPFRRTNN